MSVLHGEDQPQRQDHLFLLSAKEGDHAYLFARVREQLERGEAEEFELPDETTGLRHRYRIARQVPLNEANSDLLIDFPENWEIHPDGRTQHFSWVTDLELTRLRAPQIMRGARARRKIENETFNTLKNPGYQFEHNFGHGEKNLSVVFAMLAILVDQTQQLCCELFLAVWKKLRSKRSLWERMREMFHVFTLSSMRELWEALLHDYAKPTPIIDTS